MSWVYLDGAFLPSGQARIPVEDGALLYGRGAFETFRARRGTVYLLERHYARLKASAEAVGIPVPLTLPELRAAVQELTERCGLEDARVRLTLTAGPEGRGPCLFILAWPATDYPEQVYKEGISALVARARRNETSPLCRVKTLNYLDNLLAREEARRRGAQEAIFLNTRGLLADGSATSLFVVREDGLLTPPVEDGALPGVTRSAVMDLARAADIDIREASLTLEDLQSAQEAFLTNAVGGVMPLTSIEGTQIGSGRPGPLTFRLRELYETAAGEAR